MKTKNLLVAIIAVLLPIGLPAQSDFDISVTYLPYESAISAHLQNNTDYLMWIFNSYGAGTGSFIDFHLKDKAGKRILMREVIFETPPDFQRIVLLPPHSGKTFKFPLHLLGLVAHKVSDVYSVEASCQIQYSIRERNMAKRIHKDFTISTKQDLMIYAGYDSYAKNMLVFLNNTSDHEICISRSTSNVVFDLLDRQGNKLGTRNYPFITTASATSGFIKIAPGSSARLDYGLGTFAVGVDPARLASVEAHFTAYYDIPSQKVTKASSSRTVTIKIK